MSSLRFDSVRRERLLVALETGRTLEDACVIAGVSRATVSKWAARGRRGTDVDAEEFAQRLDAIREGAAEPLPGEEDVLRMLARAARKGSVRAMTALLVELRRANEQGDTRDPDDPFARLPGDVLYADQPARNRRRCHG